MLAFVLTGHAHFGTSMKESLELIAGPQDNFYAVDFLGSSEAEDYRKELKKNIDELSERYEEVIIFTDLLGGSPFRLASEISVEYEGVHVLSGTNLGMLLDASFSQVEGNTKDFIEGLIENAKQQLFYFELD